MWVRSSLTCLAAFALGCASARINGNGVAVTPDALLSGTALGAAQDEVVAIAADEVLAVSPEMRAFLDRFVNARATPQVKLRQLTRALIGADSFGLVFEGTTLTASETFRLRRGNCLSFSNLFVAMAREAGLDASFQEVDVPPDWTLEDDVFLLNRHVNVRIDLGTLGDHVVDFNIDDFRGSYDTRAISDARARAHYYNNIGVEHMRRGAIASALVCFRTAIREGDSRFSPAWTNLGTLYLREGHPTLAEASYLQALRVDNGDAVAMSNLARIYERRGDVERTDSLRRKVARHRNQNPYYRYQLAREAYEAGDSEGAIRHLRYAIRRKPAEGRFCVLIGMSYLRQGDVKLGTRWLSRAERLAVTGAPMPTASTSVDSP